MKQKPLKYSRLPLDYAFIKHSALVDFEKIN